MSVDADLEGPSVTATDDQRVTPIGRWLRDHKLDELPQLFNVVCGEMSLVGPRPQVPRFVEHFDASLRHVVLAVRPGITGPTTLHFRNEEQLLADKSDRESYYIQQILPTKLAMDAHYVRTRSLGDDLRVLWETGCLFSCSFGRRMTASLASALRLEIRPPRPLAAVARPFPEALPELGQQEFAPSRDHDDPVRAHASS